MGLCLVSLFLFRLLLFVYSSFVYCHFVQSTFLLLFAVVCHTLLKFNVQFNALLTTHTILQLSRPNYYPITKCTNIKITLCSKTSLELSLVFSLLPEHSSCGCNNLTCLTMEQRHFSCCLSHKEIVPRKAKTLILVIVYHNYDVSGCSLKEYPQNFNKGMQNLGKSKFNNNGANRSNQLEVKMWSRRNNSRQNWSRRNGSRRNRSRQTRMLPNHGQAHSLQFSEGGLHGGLMCLRA